MTTSEIEKRYSSLSKSKCCLSCGGAINYAAAQPGEICIDLGSGRGTDCVSLAKAVGQKGMVYGIDISDGMLERARTFASENNVLNTTFIKSPIEKIPLETDQADILISNCTINHASDKFAVWSEVFRVLKPEGRFVVSDIYATNSVPEEYRNDPEAVAACWAGAVTRSEYLTTLEAAGFSNINILEESEPYAKGAIEVSSFTIRGYKPKIEK
jgi:ubiquinone/menaquinone biosynthesis C-methylase UbiE